MQRASSLELSRWVESDGRKPLIVRGARQVGKTWLVRDLARASGLDLIEINFEQNPLAARGLQASSREPPGCRVSRNGSAGPVPSGTAPPGRIGSAQSSSPVIPLLPAK